MALCIVPAHQVRSKAVLAPGVRLDWGGLVLACPPTPADTAQQLFVMLDTAKTGGRARGVPPRGGGAGHAG